MGLIEGKSNRSTGLTEFQGEAALLQNNSYEIKEFRGIIVRLRDSCNFEILSRNYTFCTILFIPL